MEQSPPWEASSHSTSQEIHHLSWNPKVRIHKSWSLSWARCIQSTSFCQNFIVILSSYLLLGLPTSLFLSGSPTKILYALIVCTLHATCLAHLVLFDLITLIIYVEAYKLRSSSLCSLLQPPATSSLLGPDILLSWLFLTSSIYLLPLVSEIKFHTHTKQEVKLWLCIL